MDVLHAAKLHMNPAYEPEVDPPHDFREALGSTGAFKSFSEMLAVELLNLDVTSMAALIT